MSSIKIEEKIKLYLKELLNEKVIKLEFIHHGYVNANYLVKFSSSHDDVIFRIYNWNNWKRKPKKEVMILKQLDKQFNGSLPIPKVFHFVEDTKQFHKPVSVISRLQGEPLSNILPQISNSDQKRIGTQMGTFLEKIHSIKWSHFGELYLNSDEDKNRASSERDFIIDHLNRYVEDLKIIIGLDPWIPTQLKRIIDFVDEIIRNQQASLLHGDFHEANILVKKDDKGQINLTGVLDWEHAKAMGIEWDLVKLNDLGQNEWPALRKGVYQEYYREKEDIERSSRRSLWLYQILAACGYVNYFTITCDKLKRDRQVKILKNLLDHAIIAR